MPFDLPAARKRGYDDEHLANYLGKKHNFDVDAAVKAGKTHTQLAEYLSTFDTPTRLEAEPEPTFAGQATDVYKQFGSPLVQMGGLVGGGMAGLPAGPLGAVGGAGLGYGMAKKADEIIINALNRLSGIKDKSSVVEETIESLKDVRDGMMYEMGGQMAPLALTGKYSPIRKLMDPMSQPLTDAQVSRNLADARAGYGFTAAEQTGSSILAGFETIVERAPVSGAIMRDFRFQKQLVPLLQERNNLLAAGGDINQTRAVGNKIHAEVTDYLQNQTKLRGAKLDNMRRKLLIEIGTHGSPDTLGLPLQDMLKGAGDAARQNARNAYEEIGQMPSVTSKEFAPTRMRDWARAELTKRKGMSPSARKVAREDLEWASNRRQLPKELQAQLDDLPPGPQKESIVAEIEEASQRKLTWEKMQAQEDHFSAKIRESDPLRDVENVSQMTPEGRIYYNLRKELRLDMKEIAEEIGGDVWATYNLADKLWGDYARPFKSKYIRDIFKAKPERVIDVAIRPNSITEVKVLKNALGPERFQLAQDIFTNKLIGPEDVFNPKAMKQRLQKYSHHTVDEVLGKGKFNEYNELAEKGMNFAEIRPTEALMKKLYDKHPGQVVDEIVKASATRKADTMTYYNLIMIKKVLSKPTYARLENQVIERMFDVSQTTGLITPQSLIQAFDSHAQTLSRLDIKKTKQLAFIVDRARRMSASASVLAEKAPIDIAKSSIIAIRQGHLVVMRPKLGIYEMLTTRMFSKLYNSKFGLKWLTEGFKVKARTARGIELAAKLVGVMSEPLAKEIAPQYEE